MIKFELFEGQNNYQCHFKNLGAFVVSISHFMRAYFNQQALLNGNDFKLPGDAGYLNVSFACQTRVYHIIGSDLLLTYHYYDVIFCSVSCYSKQLTPM